MKRGSAEEASRGRGGVGAAAAGPAVGCGERCTDITATAVHLSVDKG